MEILGRVFDGYKVFHDGYIKMDGNQIVACGERPKNLVATNIEVLPHDQLIVPDFIDLQFNGHQDIDLRYPLTESQLKNLDSLGFKGVVATCISHDDYAAFEANLGLLSKHNLLLAIHWEGPFLALPGIHMAECLVGGAKAISAEHFTKMVETNSRKWQVPTIVTLAPEVTPIYLIEQLASIPNVFLSAGHTQANREILNAFWDKHPMVTHLFNGMGSIHHRSPGVAMEALIHPKTHCCLIGDLEHVHPTMVNVAYRLKRDKLAIVSDAVPLKSPTWPQKSGDVLRGGGQSLLEVLPRLGHALGLHWENLLRHVTSLPGRMIGLDHFLRAGYRCRPLVVKSQNQRLEIVQRLG